MDMPKTSLINHENQVSVKIQLGFNQLSLEKLSEIDLKPKSHCLWESGSRPPSRADYRGAPGRAYLPWMFAWDFSSDQFWILTLVEERVGKQPLCGVTQLLCDVLSYTKCITHSAMSQAELSPGDHWARLASPALHNRLACNPSSQERFPKA